MLPAVCVERPSGRGVVVFALSAGEARSLSDVSERCRPSESRAAGYDPNAFNRERRARVVWASESTWQKPRKGVRDARGDSELFRAGRV